MITKQELERVLRLGEARDAEIACLVASRFQRAEYGDGKVSYPSEEAPAVTLTYAKQDDRLNGGHSGGRIVR